MTCGYAFRGPTETGHTLHDRAVPKTGVPEPRAVSSGNVCLDRRSDVGVIEPASRWRDGRIEHPEKIQHLGGVLTEEAGHGRNRDQYGERDDEQWRNRRECDRQRASCPSYSVGESGCAHELFVRLDQRWEIVSRPRT